MEEVSYDSSGQPITGSLGAGGMEYRGD